MKKIKKFVDKYSKLSVPLKLFSLLISSSIIVHLSAWALDWKFGNKFFILSRESLIFSDLFSPAQDGGYFEHFQYILLVWCAILSAIWVIGRKYFELLYIPFLYFYLFLDDALLIHDRLIGIYIIEFYLKYDLFANEFVRLKDIAEWSYWLILFIVTLIFAKPSFQNKQIEIQKFIKYNFSLFIGMAFFAIFIDMISANWNNWISVESKNISFIISIFFTLLEEVGEIVVISIACVWLFSTNFKVITKDNF